MADDVPGGGIVEVRAENGDTAARVALAERAPRLARRFGIDVEVAAPLRLGHLDRMVHEIAGDDRIRVARAKAHTRVPRRVTRRGLQPDLVADPMVHLDQRREPGVQHRRDAVAHDPRGVRVARARPVLPLAPREQVTARGNVGTQRPLSSRVFHPTWSTCRCVQITTSTDSGATPATRRSSRNVVRIMWNGCRPPRSLSLPTHVSTSTVSPGERTTKVWIDC